MIFLSKKENGFLWKPSMQIAELKPAETALISKGDWVVHSVDDTNSILVSHILDGHCVVVNDAIKVLPENEWPENIDMGIM